MADAALDAALAAIDPLDAGAPCNLLVGLSGGLDSTVLLHALARRRGPRGGLRAIHVHHGLHPEADAWTEHCQRCCDSLQVPLQVVRVQVPRALALGLEGAARTARYAAFAAALQPDERLVLAHHRDDQAETVLLRLLRASGSAGLAGMREGRPFADAQLLRPLLGVAREVLRAYAIAHGLAWCEDPSNADDGADRNFLRLRVLPPLGGRWPQASAALAASAAQLAEDADLLAEATGEKLAALGGGPDWLPVPALRALDPRWRAQVLRAWTAAQGLPPLPRSAHPVLDAVLAAAHDRAACYRWRQARLRRWGDRLYAAHEPDPPSAPWSLPWDGRTPLALPHGGSLRLDGNAAGFATQFGPFTVSARLGGERIRLPGRPHSHALKDCLREAGLPPWDRRRVPLLRDRDGEVLAAADRVIGARLQAWCLAHGARLHWQRAGAD